MTNTIRPILRYFPSVLALMAVHLWFFSGCTPKVYVSSYSDSGYDFAAMKKVAVVLEDNKAQNPLFGEIFMQSALERKKFLLVQMHYFLERDIVTTDRWKGADAFLEIALAYCNPGNLTYSVPTTLGAYAKLVEVGSGRVVWKMNYAYTSAEVGSSAPMVEEVMKTVADTLIDSVPLNPRTPSMISLRGPGPGEHDVTAKKAPEETSPAAAPAEAPAVRQADAPAHGTSLSAEVQAGKKAEPRIASGSPASKVSSIRSTRDTPSRPPGTASFSVQAGAFLSKENADARISALRSHGFEPYLIQESDAESRQWHTVLIGKYPTRGDAQVAAKAVSEKTRVGTSVRVFDGR
ncbi:MAG: SPOR domain-containing protein [Thermodesulfobacteriota bacterium]